MTYATTTELAAILTVNATTNADALERVLEMATGEIDTETGRTADDLADWEYALAAQVCLARANELWAEMKAPSGWILGEVPVRLARDTWGKHAETLAPLKQSWGMA